MKATQFLILFISVFYSLACANKNPASTKNNNGTADTTVTSNIAVADSFEAGKVIAHVTCKSEESQSYALYIPLKGNKEALPVIYFFDPHGDGTLPLNKYRALAER